MRAFLVGLFSFVVAASAEPPPPAVPAPVAAAETAVRVKAAPVVRVNVTNQPHDFISPWSKKQASGRRALGAILSSRRVLVTAELVANANYLELETADTGEKCPAAIVACDYEANLALLEPADHVFLKGYGTLSLHEGRVGDFASVWQLETTGALLATRATLTTIEVGRYPLDDQAFLTYRFSVPLQYRDSSFAVPVVRDGRLLGLVMRYDVRTQTADAVPAPIIAHFLEDLEDGDYRGFPRAGLAFAETRDPQFREYIGLDGQGGVYVTEVDPVGPAALGGLRKGDVLLAVDGKTIDRDGNYDDPKLGKIALSHLIAGLRQVGDTAKFRILRDGVEAVLDVVLGRRAPEDFVIPPYTFDRGPHYFILGGLVFQELTRQYLREWGDWPKRAPQRFVYFDRFQSELFEGKRKRIVFLGQVLPTEATVGYEELALLVVTRINGMPIDTIADVAKAAEAPADGFHKIEFEDSPGVIYLDAAEVAGAEAALRANYGLPALKRVE